MTTAIASTTPYGVSPTGFYSKPFDVIASELDQDLRAILGDSAGTNSDGTIPYQSMAGQLKALLLDGFSAQWDLLQAVYANLDAAQAVGTFQDVICALTGTIRNPAEQSVATGYAIGAPNTVLSPNRAAGVAGTTVRFSTPTGTTVSIATGNAYQPNSAHAIGDVVYSGGNTWQSQSVGTGGASGPSGFGPYFGDNGVTWAFLGAGIGIAVVPFLSDVTGPIGVATGGLNTILTPVNGWNAVYNPMAAVLGAVQEADPSLRIRRDQEIATTGNATTDAILANVLSVNQGSTDPNHQPPTSVQVFYNDTDVTNVNGLPPHSVEVLVNGGTAQDIVQAIWESVAAGTATYGNTQGVAIDSEGQNQTVYYSVPTPVPIYVTAVGGYDASQWPANSQATVAQAMLSAFLTATQNFPIGVDARTSKLNAYIMQGPAGTTGGLALVPAPPSNPPVPGLLEVSTLQLGLATGPTGTGNIPIGIRSVAVFAAAQCSFSAAPETP